MSREIKAFAASADAPRVIQHARPTRRLEEILYGPNFDANDWTSRAWPFDLRSIVLGYSSQMTKEERNNTLIRVVALDDEYIRWLIANGKQDVENSRQEYMESLSDEDALRLLVSTGGEVSIEVANLGFVVLFESHKPNLRLGHFDLSEDVRAAVEDFLSYYFGKGNVWFPGWAFMPHLMKKNYSKLMDLAIGKLFLHETQVGKSPFSHVRLCRSPICSEYRISFPFFVKWETPTAVFKPNIHETFYDENKHVTIPATAIEGIELISTEVDHENEMVPNVPLLDITELDFYEKLSKFSGATTAIIDPILVPSNLTYDVEKHLDEIFSRNSRKSDASEYIANVASVSDFKGSRGPEWMHSITLQP